MADEQKLPTPAKTEEKNPELPIIYFNGFEVVISLSDICVRLVTNGHPHNRLLMSFTTAKTLMAHLKRAVDVFEKRASHTILTMEDIDKALKQNGDGTEKV